MEELNIIYEDNHVLVVIKPQNIPTQADDSNDLDMLTMVKNYIKEKYNKPGEVYVGLIHRLDRPTGGVMVFAKTSKAASRLSDQIRKNEIKKSSTCATFKFKWQGWRESNSQQRFWRPLLYHLTTPLFFKDK